MSEQEDFRPMISVCMASFNGRDYVETQLASVLPQLRSGDEVVIVDDGSTDGALEVIRSIDDPRIRLREHACNQGVVATFEEALCAARGEILFLCDNDDRWAADKVDRFLQAFAEHPDANIVTSQITLIDASGAPLNEVFYTGRETFQPGFWSNILRNHFQGSAMALRRSFLEESLPFPRNVEFLHDSWLGTRNALVGGGVVFLAEPLLEYRRHSGNFSRKKPLWNMLRTRFQLLREHLKRAFSRRLAGVGVPHRTRGSR